MNLTLSRRGDYVVRAALCLAHAYEGGGSKKIREVVSEMGVPQTYASQILAELVRAKLATSKAGKDGGYRLCRSPETVTLLEIVEAGEGPLRAERCVLGDGPCRWDAVCPLHQSWGEATAQFRRALAETTLQDLIERDDALADPEHSVPIDSHRHGVASLGVEDWVQVEVMPEAIAEYLVEVEGDLERVIVSAYQEADRLRASLDPVSLPWVVTTVTAMVAPIRDGSVQDNERFSLIWQTGGQRASQSRMEGVLTLVVIDDSRTELRLHSTFRPPEIILRSESDLTERLARATLRSVLRGIAFEVELRAAAIQA